MQSNKTTRRHANRTKPMLFTIPIQMHSLIISITQLPINTTLKRRIGSASRPASLSGGSSSSGLSMEFRQISHLPLWRIHSASSCLALMMMMIIMMLLLLLQRVQHVQCLSVCVYNVKPRVSMPTRVSQTYQPASQTQHSHSIYTNNKKQSAMTRVLMLATMSHN